MLCASDAYVPSMFQVMCEGAWTVEWRDSTSTTLHVVVGDEVVTVGIEDDEGVGQAYLWKNETDMGAMTMGCEAVK